MQTCETTVCNGFPVMVEYTMAPAEPDVGIFIHFVAEMFIKTLKGKSASFIELKMTQEDWSLVEEACYKDDESRMIAYMNEQEAFKEDHR